ncbi:hypothetical protein KCU92_g105, partial [Aureobasidium melanogenum]
MLKRLIKRTKRLNRDCTSVLTSVDLHISRSSVLSNESATLLEMLFPPVWGKCARLESDLTCPACQVHRYAGRTYGQIMLSGRQRRKGCHPLRSVASSYPLANTRDQCEGLRQNLQMMPTRWLHLLDQLPERMKYWKQLRMVSFYSRIPVLDQRCCRILIAAFGAWPFLGRWSHRSPDPELLWDKTSSCIHACMQSSAATRSSLHDVLLQRKGLMTFGDSERPNSKVRQTSGLPTNSQAIGNPAWPAPFVPVGNHEQADTPKLLQTATLMSHPYCFRNYIFDIREAGQRDMH